MPKFKLDHHQAPYAPMFAGWLKKWGSKPTSENLQIAHHMVSTRGGKHAVYIALALRPEGVHDWQNYEATQLFDYVGGDPQYLHVYRNRVCDSGMFDRETVKHIVDASKPFGGSGSKPNTHTKMKLTAKGLAEFKKHLAAGTVEASFKRTAAKHIAEFEVQQAALREAIAAKTKATREANKATKLASESAASEAPQISELEPTDTAQS